jgi:uncharacterized protein (DUF2141 family)
MFYVYYNMKEILFLLQMTMIGMGQDAPRHDLTVNIAHVTDTHHQIYIAISKKSNGFPGDPDVVRYITWDPAGRNSLSVSIPDIPYGKYAIMIFQDLNGNKKLDKGFLGIPNEPIAFSNDFHPLFGPPRWKDCEFDYSVLSYTVSINKLFKI